MIVRARAPLRLGLGGGGTDVSPFCDTHGGYVLNATIDRYAYAVIQTLSSPQIEFVAADKQEEKVNNIGEPLEYNGKLDLHKAVYNEMILAYNEGKPIPLKLITFCDAPPGSGLGSSSTLVVAMVRAFVELLNVPLDDYGIARLAYKVEREICGLQGGRQDQYSATFGGFNFMEFYKDERAIINPLRIKNWIVCELESSLLLYYTGVSRESARIISDQSNNVIKGKVSAIEALNTIKEEAVNMKECLLKADFSGIVDSMQRAWESKKKSATTVSNSYLDQIYDAAISSGALAGKVSGAGGGGFMMFYVPIDRRMEVIRTLNTFHGQVSNCHFTKHGSQAWRL